MQQEPWYHSQHQWEEEPYEKIQMCDVGEYYASDHTLDLCGRTLFSDVLAAQAIIAHMM